MIDHDGLAVSAEEVGESDHAIGGRDDRVAVGAADIHTAVKRAFSVKWVDALTEAAGDLAFHRPEVGRGTGAGPIGGGGVASHAQADADCGCAGEGGSAQGTQLVKGRTDLSVLNSLLRGGD